ncbi:ATP-dependent DNA helicase PIF1 [Pochonia chlamydosporia 170]|uniref:ATP-dependent DNA helicase n=1 Tax=Pochonia chlamydosporia 170 TaxID=1380566 RepID=A0A179EZ12_METCM|nr:ATP-dependent DNA helicase PIF1 [Pochonia chlamydosporia 170]OAQ58434.1 ATP-dependent DNA helicase PIF1 [Pochonia chlamydosporia 170]
MKMLQIVLTLIAAAPTIANLQGRHRCGAARASRRSATDTDLPYRTDVNSTTPIVVDTYMHAISNSTTSAAHLSRETLDKQLEVLNQDFKAARISFKLRNVTWTINEDWSNGAKGSYEGMMNTLQQGGNDALNLYFVDRVTQSGLPNFAPNEISDLLGFASMPPDANASDSTSSNCVINSGTTPGGYMNGTNLGRTATHEVGHWFGLEHVFEGGCNPDPALGDFVADTPASADSSTGCPIGKHSCPDLPGLDAIHNFMDYSDDDCSNEFTRGQIMRMHALWEKYRKPPSKESARPTNWAAGGRIIQRPYMGKRQEAFNRRGKLPIAQAPEIRQTPIDELGRKHRLFAMCFPTLFPYGTADWHQGRIRNVSLADWAEHFLKFHDGRFGARPRFRFLVFNMLMRKKAQEASGFWVKKRPDLLGLSLDELKELLGEESTLLKSIVRSGATLTGTRPYWRQKENALKATARYFGTTGTVFYTWSCADHQWDDLHRHLPRYDHWRDGTDEDRRKIAWENVQRFPHIIAAWLDILFKAFLKYVMTSFLGLDDYWFRYEWQARGTGHIHCIIWMRDSPAMGARTPEQREAFAQYWNRKVTAVNPNSTRPPDARNPASLPFIHICNTDEQVAIFMNRFQMHAKCAPGRCLRKNKTTNIVECRFFFPRELQERALVTKSINKKSWMLGVQRNVERLAQCSPVMALGWLANTDLQPAVTYKGLILYVAKYVSKPEIKSASYQELQDQILPYVSDHRPITSFAARLLNKLVGERDWSAQEISHILLKIPQQKSTRQCMVLDCRPDQAQDRHIQFDDGEAGEEMMLREGLSAYKRYKLRVEHASGGEHLRDVTLINWLQHYDVSKFQRLSKGKPRPVTFFPRYKSNPTDDEYEDYCRVKMMLSHPFEKVEDLLQVDGFLAETFQEAYELCCDNHNHGDDLYDELDVDDDDAESDGDDEFEAVDPSRPTPPAPLADFETYGLAHPGNDLTRVEDGDNLGERDSDREYDWSRHVGKYDIDPSFWHVTKRAFPAEQLLPSLNSVDLLNGEQRTVYNLIVDHYSDFLAGRNPPQLMVSLDGVAGTGKTYVLLQAIKKLEEMATIAGVRDPVLRAAPTGIAAHNFHGRTLHSLFKIPVKTPPQGLSQKLSRSNLCSLQALFKHCRYLIIDEKSMIGIKFLGLLDQRLREIFPAQCIHQPSLA